MTQPIHVVVPTRERADTLFHCLETIVAQDCDRLVIWVSDNASSPATRDVVESFNDPRIRYRNTGQRLSMAKNYEFALSQIADGWIVMIGDDDGLLPGRLEPAIAELEQSGLNALSTETCFYNWPQAAPDDPVRLTIPLEETAIRVAGRAAMAEMLKCERHKFRLPQTYTGGIVHADVYRAIKDRRGTFFQSQIPDIFSGYAIASTVESFLYSKKPFAIAGRSSHSIGQALFRMEKNPFLDEELIPFHPDFPMPDGGTLTFSMPAIQFECHAQAAYLHGGDPAVDKQHMLAVILANSEFGRTQILAWGQQFAAFHGLDYAAAVAEAGPIGRRSRLVNRGRALRNLWDCARIYRGDPWPLANVREASETAAAILRDPPGRIASSLRTLIKKRSG